MPEEKKNLYRYIGETKNPIQIENEDGSITIVKLINGIILTQEVISPDREMGMINPLEDVNFFEEHNMEVELVEE